ncbi:hypothetical protein B0I35DRAFT_36131 [Stachybotrys elegans]|uniref:Uncharacterized protein n=1 Tax=Stachybotrys elegans TaxID=80388 RepID=A0A8K0WWW0_9HYPO|nr:hypothetical protein B0I35DRAFT_36131 [Stachybotrys elegans]
MAEPPLLQLVMCYWPRYACALPLHVSSPCPRLLPHRLAAPRFVVLASRGALLAPSSPLRKDEKRRKVKREREQELASSRPILSHRASKAIVRVQVSNSSPRDFMY